jgi:hypothetical protein
MENMEPILKSSFVHVLTVCCVGGCELRRCVLRET